VVVAANVLHLIPDLEAGIDALCAMVRPGGRLIVPTFCHAQSVGSRLLSRVMGLTGFPGRRRFTLTTLAAALEARGATVERARLLPGVLPIGYVQCVVGARR
jgi:2-polyprenyl-3-methyl-5-hydroxy-6-metoxy-1,4-benzoquinol methylase